MNVFICMSLMIYKTYVDPKGFMGAEKIGLRITTLGETFSKISSGLFIGGLNIFTVLFGLYAVKNVNVPIFLCFRRCSILCTILVEIVVRNAYPNLSKTFCSALIAGGAILAGWDGFNSDSFGYFLVICNNFS